MLNGGCNFGCSSLPKVPFKPQHSLFLRRVHLLPSLYHQLILDRVTPNTHVWLDQMVRKVVQKSIKGLALPIAWCIKVHVSCQSGQWGQGIPMLCVHMCIAKRDRLNRFLDRAASETDPVCHWLVDYSVTVDSDQKQYQTVKTNRRLTGKSEHVHFLLF